MGPILQNGKGAQKKRDSGAEDPSVFVLVFIPDKVGKEHEQQPQNTQTKRIGYSYREKQTQYNACNYRQ